MKFAKFLVFLLALGSPTGCRKVELDTPLRSSVQTDGLSVSIEIPKRVLDLGEDLQVIVAAANVTGRPIRIIADTRALVYVKIWRHTGLDWEEVKRYPQAATMVMTPWSIEGGSERRFVMLLTVEPDWPTGEVLAMTGELNGWEQAIPQVKLEVAPPSRAVPSPPAGETQVPDEGG